MKLTDRLNKIIGGVEKKVTDTVTRVKKNVAEDQKGLKNGTVGRYQATNPLRK